MTKREFLDTVFALAPNEANAIMDAFDEYVDSNEPHCIHAGDIEADCPKWKCDNPTMDCERCEFLKEYKKEVTE